MRITLLAVVIAAAALAHPLAPGIEAREAPPVYRIDPARSVAQFTVTKLGFEDVAGTFRESWGEIRWLASAPQAGYIRWHIKVASVVTDATNRDRTLQSVEYFDAARHPELIFESTSVRALDANRLDVQGRLSMRGVTRQQTVVVRHSRPATAPVFETDFNVDRYDFGITGGSVMGRLIGRTVRIHLRAVTMEHTL
ncbi:MAG: YceI family protein [Vicinamibacterales bacterium]